LKIQNLITRVHYIIASVSVYEDQSQLELSLIHNTPTEMYNMTPQHNTNEQYMVLYNGNAEVVGNFRALNFYKASDINIKEDIRLISECTSFVRG
jgi:hypothetical protein